MSNTNNLPPEVIEKIEAKAWKGKHEDFIEGATWALTDPEVLAMAGLVKKEDDVDIQVNERIVEELSTNKVELARMLRLYLISKSQTKHLQEMFLSEHEQLSAAQKRIEELEEEKSQLKQDYDHIYYLWQTKKQ